MSVCENIDSSFFVFWWNRAISWPSVLHNKNYKTLFLDFSFVAMATKFGLFLQKFQIASFLFIDGIEPFSGRQFSMWHSTKRCSSIFDLGPLTPKIYSPKFGTKSPISPLVWQTDWRCLDLLGGFQGWPIQWNHTKCCGVDPCCHGNEIWAIIAYNSICTADRPQMFRPSRGFLGMADSMQPCKIL